MTTALLVSMLMLTAPPAQMLPSSRREPVPPRLDAVAVSMTKMRLASTLVTETWHRTGAYPLADGDLHLLADAVRGEPLGLNRGAWLDGWGRPLRYRALRGVHQVVSYGSDGVADTDYGSSLLYAGRWWQVTDAAEAGADLVLVDGRFVKRPFGDKRREFETVNAINAIYLASASFAVDNNRFPGDSGALVPVAALEADLVPVYMQELPKLDGWGRPLLYSNATQRFQLASYGEDGAPDIFWYDQMTCDHGWWDPGPSPGDGGDIVQMCGEWAYWSRGVEP